MKPCALEGIQYPGAEPICDRCPYQDADLLFKRLVCTHKEKR